MEFIIFGIIAAAILLVIWIVSVQRRLVHMDENINNAMNQIGLQLSSRFDALIGLLNLTKAYAAKEAQGLLEGIKTRRNVITAASTPEEVLKQEEVISDVLGQLSLVAEQYPDLKADDEYTKYRKAVDSYEKMINTSRLIYNDSVNRMNRDVRTFPVSLAAGLLGFRQREYMEAFDKQGTTYTI